MSEEENIEEMLSEGESDIVEPKICSGEGDCIDCSCDDSEDIDSESSHELTSEFDDWMNGEFLNMLRDDHSKRNIMLACLRSSGRPHTLQEICSKHEIDFKDDIENLCTKLWHCYMSDEDDQ